MPSCTLSSRHVPTSSPVMSQDCLLVRSPSWFASMQTLMHVVGIGNVAGLH